MNGVPSCAVLVSTALNGSLTFTLSIFTTAEGEAIPEASPSSAPPPVIAKTTSFKIVMVFDISSGFLLAKVAPHGYRVRRRELRIPLAVFGHGHTVRTATHVVYYKPVRFAMQAVEHGGYGIEQRGTVGP